MVKRESEPVGLGDAAQSALQDMGEGVQEVLDDTSYVKVKFVGMAFDSLDDTIKIGDEMTFLVRSRCIGVAEEALKDGHTRQIRKMDVQSVVVAEPQQV